MTTSRVEAFSDGVIAVIITIMVLELRVPLGSSVSALRPIVPSLLMYLLSFVTIAIVWNNHHHLLYATKHISGGIMWANMHLLFWLSLIPFATSWLGENHGGAWPTALYSLVFLLTGMAYTILERSIIANKYNDSVVIKALRNDYKSMLSVIAYVLAVVFAFILPIVSYVLVAGVALAWFIPDRRIESKIKELS